MMHENSWHYELSYGSNGGKWGAVMSVIASAKSEATFIQARNHMSYAAISVNAAHGCWPGWQQSFMFRPPDRPGPANAEQPSATWRTDWPHQPRQPVAGTAPPDPRHPPRDNDHPALAHTSAAEAPNLRSRRLHQCLLRTLRPRRSSPGVLAAPQATAAAHALQASS